MSLPAFLKNSEKRTLLLLGFSALSLGVSFFAPGILPFDAAWAAILLCGIPIVKGAVVGLVTAFDIKADVLVSLALVASLVIGETFAAGEVAFIMAIGAFLEERTVSKARAGIEKLVHLTPATARVVQDGTEHVVAAEQVEVGDVLRVLAGETVAVDGVIVMGQTSIDQSVMTGEPIPVDKGEGDEVLSGTVNQFGTFDMVAQKVGEDSSLQRMIRLVESADAGKARIVGVADRWATWIVVVALAAAAVTWLVTGEAIRAVTVLVVFCPCALVLATPTAIMAGIGNATRYGILVSQGDALERLAQVRCVAFDKTGTLTFGKPAVTEVESCIDGLSDEHLLELTASAELRSEHPLGKAIVGRWRLGRRQQGRKDALPEPEDFRLLAGRGVEARIGGNMLFAGNEALLAERGLSLPPSLGPGVAAAREQGATLVYVMDEGQVLGILALSDTLRPDAARTVRELGEAGLETVLFTGDSAQAAQHVARRTGIAEVRARCLPQDKLAAIQSAQQEGRPVCMVGDGINDAPALKCAQVGIAMGGIGSDIAIEAADIVLVSDDIGELGHLLSLSRRMMRTIHLNLAASMALNFVAIALAVTGILDPVLGALVHNVGSVAVIINSSLLLNWRRRKKADEYRG
ncbi:MAG: cation-translocating P-type ATPase [Coriobacteriales bacterium]|nr:cation-translocating P-type ATPase [Coriobacteriales bacterium]